MLEKDILARFLAAIKDTGETLDNVAKAIGTSKAYLSQLKTKQSTKIPALMIANFCQAYNYSPYWLLLGKGKRKAGSLKDKEEKLIDIIGDLMDAMLELKPVWNDATKELIHQVKNRVQ